MPSLLRATDSFNSSSATITPSGHQQLRSQASLEIEAALSGAGADDGLIRLLQQSARQQYPHGANAEADAANRAHVEALYGGSARANSFTFDIPDYSFASQTDVSTLLSGLDGEGGVGMRMDGGGGGTIMGREGMLSPAHSPDEGQTGHISPAQLQYDASRGMYDPNTGLPLGLNTNAMVDNSNSNPNANTNAFPSPMSMTNAEYRPTSSASSVSGSEYSWSATDISGSGEDFDMGGTGELMGTGAGGHGGGAGGVGVDTNFAQMGLGDIGNSPFHSFQQTNQLALGQQDQRHQGHQDYQGRGGSVSGRSRLWSAASASGASASGSVSGGGGGIGPVRRGTMEGDGNVDASGGGNKRDLAKLEHRRSINRKSAQKHRARRREELDTLSKQMAERDARIAQLERDLAVERAKSTQLLEFLKVQQGLVGGGGGGGAGTGGGTAGRGDGVRTQSHSRTRNQSNGRSKNASGSGVEGGMDNGENDGGIKESRELGRRRSMRNAGKRDQGDTLRSGPGQGRDQEQPQGMSEGDRQVWNATSALGGF